MVHKTQKFNECEPIEVEKEGDDYMSCALVTQ